MAEPVRAHRTGDQPLPVPNDRPSIQSLVRADLDKREQVGIQRYGTALQAFNGRDVDRDLYEELLDAACYMRQRIEERDNPQPDPPLPDWERELLERQAERDGLRFHLQRLVIMAGGSWDQDRIEECVEEAAARLRELRAKEDAQGDADERLAKALARVEKWKAYWQEADREWAKDRALGQWLVTEARAEVVRLAQELQQERRVSRAYAEQAIAHRCRAVATGANADADQVSDLLIQEGTRG